MGLINMNANVRHKLLAALCAFESIVHWAGANGADAETPMTIDACALLITSEISQVIGLPIEAGTREDAGLQSNGSYSSTCVWRIKLKKVVPVDPTAPLGGQSFVILNAMQWPAGSGRAHEFLDAFRSAALKGEIPGKPSPRPFGDEALWWGDGLAVRRNDVSFGISVFMPGLGLKSTGTFEEKLAPQVLRRLKHREQQIDR